MDVHSGNLVADEKGLHLIDWEYAADGDIALELAALCAAAPEHKDSWLESYAQAAQLSPVQLARQSWNTFNLRGLRGRGRNRL